MLDLGAGMFVCRRPGALKEPLTEPDAAEALVAEPIVLSSAVGLADVELN